MLALSSANVVVAVVNILLVVLETHLGVGQCVC
jgi:hypothetical protein